MKASKQLVVAGLDQARREPRGRRFARVPATPAPLRSRWRYCAIAAIVVFALTLCYLLGALTTGDDAVQDSVRVVDAFINARAAGDVKALAASMREDVVIVDMSHDRMATGKDSLVDALPLSHTFTTGPRYMDDLGQVIWTETALTARTDDDSILDRSTHDVITAGARWLPARPTTKLSTRTIQASVVQGKIKLLVVFPAVPLQSVRSTLPGLPRFFWTQVLVVVGTLIIGLVIWRPSADALASDRLSADGSKATIVGLKTWFAQKRTDTGVRCKGPSTNQNGPNQRAASNSTSMATATAASERVASVPRATRSLPVLGQSTAVRDGSRGA